MGALKGRIALITGASRGIGAAVATRFAAEGAHVILTARSTGGLEEVDDQVRAVGGSATLVPLDLKEPGKIESLAAPLAERFGKLDILVGNAASLGTLTPLAHATADVWEKVMLTNLAANSRLIRTLDPLLKASDAGRAIFVTSGIVKHPTAYWGPYAVSKAALEMLVKTYAAELVKTAVRANLLDPGIVRTSMRATAFPGEDPMSLAEPESIAGHFVELASASCTKNGEVVRAY